MDPDAIIAEITASTAERQRIETEYETIKSGFKGLWTQWILKYKTILSIQTQSDETRAAKMNKVNPRFILRNYLLQEAIVQAETQRDFTGVKKLLTLAQNPFVEPADPKVCANKPSWAYDLCVSCSS